LFAQNTDEIEIEIDAFPPAVLWALWNAVVKPKQAPSLTGCGFDKRQTFQNWAKPSGLVISSGRAWMMPRSREDVFT